MFQAKKKDGFKGQRAIIIPSKIHSAVCKKHEVIKQLFITDIGYYPNAEHHHRQRPQGSRQHIIIYCKSGKGMVRIKNQWLKIGSNEFIILPANVEHEYKADQADPWTIYWVHFNGPNSPHFVQMMIHKMGGFHSSITFQENRLHLFEEIYVNLEKGYGIDNLCYANICLQYYLSSFCFDSNYNYQYEKNKNNYIDFCIKYMQENLNKTITLEEIAAAVNLSPSHLTTTFKKKTGFTLIEYFNHLKIQKACQYLLFTNLRVNEIALELGIEDPFYFTRMFTKNIGLSPVKYRKNKKSESKISS